MTGDRRPRVAVLDDYQGVTLQYADWSVLDGRAEVTVFRDHLHDDDAVVARLAPFDAVCLMRERTPLTVASIDRLPNLKLIVTTGMGNASLDVDHAIAKGITVCGTSGVGSGTPELVWLHVLNLARGFRGEDASVRAGRWQAGVGMDLRGRTMGLIGLGNIGSHVARVAGAFGMRVIAWSQNLTAERASEKGAAYADEQTLLRESDFVVIALKLSERTRHLVGAAELTLMKPTAFLVNVSRGPIVDEAALVEALRHGRIAGAGLDVFDVEPLPLDHPFRSLPNVVVTPHIGYVTEATYRVFYAQTVEAVDAWLRGAPVRGITPAAPDASSGAVADAPRPD